jgi:hypothetical protein
VLLSSASSMPRMKRCSSLRRPSMCRRSRYWRAPGQHRAFGRRGFEKQTHLCPAGREQRLSRRFDRVHCRVLAVVSNTIFEWLGCVDRSNCLSRQVSPVKLRIEFKFTFSERNRAQAAASSARKSVNSSELAMTPESATVTSRLARSVQRSQLASSVSRAAATSLRLVRAARSVSATHRFECLRSLPWR